MFAGNGLPWSRGVSTNGVGAFFGETEFGKPILVVWMAFKGTDLIALFSIQKKDVAAMSESFAVGFGEVR